MNKRAKLPYTYIYDSPGVFRKGVDIYLWWGEECSVMIKGKRGGVTSVLYIFIQAAKLSNVSQ